MNSATEKQITFLLKLVADKILPGFDQTLPKEELDRLNAECLAKSETWARGATRKAVSEQIARLCALSAPAPKNVAPAVTEPGFYLLDGAIVKVQKSQAGRLYAKTLVVSTKRFEYAAGVVHRLTTDNLLTLEQAAKFGHQTGVCAVCARDLSDPVSVERGIGPVCYKRFS